MPQLIQVLSRNNNRLAGLSSDGVLYEQVREFNAPLRWAPVHAEGLEEAGRLVHLAISHDGRLIAVSSRGRVYEQQGTGRLGDQLTWRAADPAGLE
jgi:hypothetical protein